MTVNIRLNEKSIDSAKPKKQRKRLTAKQRKVVIISSVLIVLVGIALLCGHFFGEKTGLRLSITDILSPVKADPQLKKDSSGQYTNALLVGIDTRENNPGLQNTDTIILLSYNHEKHHTSLFSIPRDFFVEVPNQGRYTKINGIYAIGEMIEQGTGLDFLKSIVEEITNQEIQYYGMVNLAGFKDLIDTVDGIEVDVENTFTDYRYPTEGAEHRYETITFQEGLQTMNGSTALKFVRSRHSMDNAEGSDFARARRQQRVISALKDKILSSETLLNPKKALGVLNVLEKNVKYSDFTNEEMQAVIKLLQKGDMDTYSFVLDPNLASFKIITDKGLTLDAYTIGPIAGLGNYEEIHKYVSYAIEKPLMYSTNPSIYIYDVGLGYNEAIIETETFEEELPYIDIKFMGTLMNDIQGKYLYTESENNENLNQKLSRYLSIDLTEKPEFMEEKVIPADYIILLGSND
mgnify:CR=1 FL=1